MIYPNNYQEPSCLLDALKMLVMISKEDADEYNSKAFDYRNHELLFDTSKNYSPKELFQRSDIHNKCRLISELMTYKFLLIQHFTVDFFHLHRSVIKKVLQTNYSSNANHLENIVQQFKIIYRMLSDYGVSHSHEDFPFVNIVYMFETL